MGNHDKIEKNVLKIVAKNITSVMSIATYLLYVAILSIILILKILFPEHITLSGLNDIAQAIIGFSGATIALLALRVYTDDDLVALYDAENDHSDYEAYIAEYLFAIIAWLGACLSFFLSKIIDLSVLDDTMIFILKFLYASLLLLNIFDILDLFIKNILRLTVKTKINSKNRH